MISRFFSNIHFRRVLCCLLALLTLGCCLSPAFVQPAEAVAVADDVLIASLALLAVSWAGITFNTIAGANSGVSRFLNSKPMAKLSLAGLLTKELIVDGTKLLLTSDVRDVFNTILPDIKSTFPSDAATSPSTDSNFKGAYYNNIPVGVPLNAPDDFFTKENASLALKSPRSLGLIYCLDLNGCKAYIDGVPVTLFCRRRPGYGICFPFYAKRLDDGSILFDEIDLTSDFFVFSSEDGILSTYCAYNYGDHIDWRRFCQLPFSSIVIYETPGTATLEYNQSKEVDGTQIQEITWGVQFVPDPNDPTEPTNPDDGNKRIPVWPLGPVQAPFDPNISQDAANQDPGLSPEEMIAELKKLLEAQQTGGGDSGTTNPNPNPNPDPDPGPDAPGGADVPPNFNQMMTPNLKDFFPFCIPGDIKKMIDALCAAPEAPKFTFATSFMGQVYSVNIDLSPWDGVATSVRYMVVAVYIAALAVATRKFIKW